MRATVRPLDDSTNLREGTDRLRALVYPAAQDSHDPRWHRLLWRWLESHPLAAEHMHRWVLATEADEVVGHLAATPQWYRINGQRVIAHTPADYQVLPQYGFQALLLMRKFFRTIENCVSIDMLPSVIAVETRLGAEEAGEMQYMAKLLNVSRLPAPPLPSRIKKLLNLEERPVLNAQPAPAYADRPGTDPQGFHENVVPPPSRPRAPIPKPVQGLLNGGLQVVDKALGSAFGGALKVEVLDEFDESFDEMFEKVAAEVPVLPEKNAEFLRWRYGPGSPQHPVTILGVRGREGLLGYAVLGVTIQGFFDGLRDGYVLDLMTLPGRHDVSRALLREVVSHFRQSGVPLFRYRFLESSTSPQRSDLLKLGFFPRKGRRNSLLVKFADPGLHKAARDINNWSYSIGDGEATFWVRLS